MTSVAARPRVLSPPRGGQEERLCPHWVTTVLPAALAGVPQGRSFLGQSEVGGWVGGKESGLLGLTPLSPQQV